MNTREPHFPDVGPNRFWRVTDTDYNGTTAYRVELRQYNRRAGKSSYVLSKSYVYIFDVTAERLEAVAALVLESFNASQEQKTLLGDYPRQSLGGAS